MAAHLSLSTATLLVFSHGAAPYSLTTTKGARQEEDVVTLHLVRIKMALEVPHLSCPLTAFPVVLAEYLEVVDLTLEELVEASARQNVRFAGVLLFAGLDHWTGLVDWTETKQETAPIITILLNPRP